MRRLTAFLLIAAMLTGLTACSGPARESGNSTEKNTENGTEQSGKLPQDKVDPGGFDPGQMPGGFPGNFDPGQMPNMPEDFDPNQMPGGFDPGSIPDIPSNSGPGNIPGMPDDGTVNDPGDRGGFNGGSGRDPGGFSGGGRGGFNGGGRGGFNGGGFGPGGDMGKGTASEGDSGLAAREVTHPAEAEALAKKITGAFSVTAEEGTAPKLKDGIYTVTAAGTYRLSGKLTEGQILIKAGENDKVTLILDNADLSCSTDSPIKALSADKVTVKTEEGSFNRITDVRAVKTEDTEAGNGAVYAKCDLTVSGKGALVVTAGYNNGIHTTKDLTVKNLTLQVTAPNNALKGNDSVTVESGNLLLTSTGGDGIKTEDSDVSSKGKVRGSVTFKAGTVEIHAAYDGIDAARDVILESDDLILNIYCGSEEETQSTSGYDSRGSFGGWGSFFGGQTAANDTPSMKGIKAASAVKMQGGILHIEAADDGIHANADEKLEDGTAAEGRVEITGGYAEIYSADDAIHADDTLLISGGTVNIRKSFEGLEANQLLITGGEHYVYASDDGLNASGKAKTPLIQIDGGYLQVATASGDTDAIDSNGSYVQNGGFVLVRGGASTGSVAGSVDVEKTITVKGGTIIALGGICETPGSGSCCSLVLNRKSFAAGSYSLKDGSGNVLASFTLPASYSGFWMSSDQLTRGQNYCIEKDGSSVISWTQNAQTSTGS